MRWSLIPLLIAISLLIASCEPPHDNPLDPGNPESNAPAPQNVEKLLVESKAEKVVLKWEPVEGAAKYRVYRRGPGEEEFKPIGETSETTYIDSNIRPGARYRYKVTPLYLSLIHI